MHFKTFVTPRVVSTAQLYKQLFPLCWTQSLQPLIDHYPSDGWMDGWTNGVLHSQWSTHYCTRTQTLLSPELDFLNWTMNNSIIIILVGNAQQRHLRAAIWSPTIRSKRGDLWPVVGLLCLQTITSVFEFGFNFCCYTFKCLIEQSGKLYIQCRPSWACICLDINY